MANIILFEIFIKEITFAETYQPVPAIDDIALEFRLTSLFVMTLAPSETVGAGGQDSTRLIGDPKININLGKTCVFCCAGKRLLNELKSPLEITLLVRRHTEAVALHTWHDEIAGIIRRFNQSNNQKQTVSAGFDFTESFLQEDNSIGEISFFLRLSVFDEKVEHDFQFDDQSDNSTCTFRNPLTGFNFQCSNLDKGKSNEIVVIDQILPTNAGSWVSVFMDPSEFETADMTGVVNTAVSDDMISICYRPAENKFMNLLDLGTAEVSTRRDETIITVKMDKTPSKLHHKKSDSIIKDPESFYCMKNCHLGICDCIDCPAAKKFKEFGLGPLATGKGLGTIYNDVKPTVGYGMSQTYGTLDYYGPYGLLVTPESLESQKSPESPEPSELPGDETAEGGDVNFTQFAEDAVVHSSMTEFGDGS